MKKLSLFSGIGGDDLASEWAGIETVCFVEKDKYCQKVLRKHWPEIPIIEDVKDVTRERITEIMADTDRNGTQRRQSENGQGSGIEQRGEVMADTEQYSTRSAYRAQSYSERSNDKRYNRDGLGYDTGNSSNKAGIDIISGGFPCQPHSVAGKRKGSVDERDLWPEFRRIIGLFKPRWVVGENVPGIFASNGGLFFNGIISDLAAMGYSVGWCTYGAVDVGALHRRDRVFIVAYRESDRTRGIQNEGEQKEAQSGYELLGIRCGISGIMADPDQQRGRSRDTGRENAENARQPSGYQGERYWQSEPDVGRVANGVPHRVDRLRGLGNAVVPQQVYPIYKAIAEIEEL